MEIKTFQMCFDISTLKKMICFELLCIYFFYQFHANTMDQHNNYMTGSNVFFLHKVKPHLRTRYFIYKLILNINKNM